MIDVFLFVTALTTIIIMIVVIYVVCGHSKLKTSVTNIALRWLKGVETTDLRFQDIHCPCKIQWYMIAVFEGSRNHRSEISRHTLSL